MKHFVTGFSLAIALMVIVFSFVALAQSPAPSPLPVSGGALVAIVNSKGGLVAFIILVMACVNIIMSSVRLALYKWDGVNPGDQIPADDKALTLVNKICLFLGKIVDFIGQNVQH